MKENGKYETESRDYYMKLAWKKSNDFHITIPRFCQVVLLKIIISISYNFEVLINDIKPVEKKFNR